MSKLSVIKGGKSKDTEEELPLEEVIKKNKKNEERLKKEREAHNRKTKREYRLDE